MSDDHLPRRFESWAELAGDSPTSRTEWAAIVGAWSEPHRRYHGLAHLAAVLGLVRELGAAASDPDAVALAAWYHDVAYDPERDDNEQVSATGRGPACAAWFRRTASTRWHGWCC